MLLDMAMDSAYGRSSISGTVLNTCGRSYIPRTSSWCSSSLIFVAVILVSVVLLKVIS